MEDRLEASFKVTIYIHAFKTCSSISTMKNKMTTLNVSPKFRPCFCFKRESYLNSFYNESVHLHSKEVSHFQIKKLQKGLTIKHQWLFLFAGNEGLIDCGVSIFASLTQLTSNINSTADYFLFQEGQETNSKLVNITRNCPFLAKCHYGKWTENERVTKKYATLLAASVKPFVFLTMAVFMAYRLLKICQNIVYDVKGFVHLTENHCNKQLQKQIRIDKKIHQISLKKNVMYHFKVTFMALW